MAASYPTAVKTFSARSNSQTIDASHMNDVQDEITAIEAGLLNGTAPLTSSNASVARLAVSSNLQVTGNSSFAGSMNIAGASTITSDLVVGGNAGIGGSLAVAGTSTITSNLNVGGQLALSGALVFGGVQNSTFSGGNTNDLSLGAGVFYLRLSASALSTITGITGAGGNNRMICIQNVGSFAIHLPHQNAGSLSTNRFTVAGAVGSTLATGAGIFAIYDGGWRPITL